jgi:hypothetical protein
METEDQAFLAYYPPEARDLAWKLRALVFEAIPKKLELVMPGKHIVKLSV